MVRSVLSGHGFSLNDVEQRRLDREQQVRNQLIDPQSLGKTTVGRWRPQVLEMPGIALLLLPLWAVGPDRYAPLQLLQLVIDALLVLAIYWIATRLTGRRLVGYGSATLYALSPAAIVLARTPSLDTWAGFLTIAIVGAFLWALERPESRRLIAIGVITGCAMYARPFLILVPLALALAAARSWRFILLPAIVALLMLAPWTVRNWTDFHRVVPARTGLGQALWEGLGERANTFGATNNDAATLAFVHRSRPDLTYGTPAFDTYLLKKSLSAIGSDPLHYAELVVRRLVYLAPCLLLLVRRRRLTRERLLFASVAVAVVAPYILVRMETRFWVTAAFAYFLLGMTTLATFLTPRPYVDGARDGAPSTAASNA